MGAMTSKKREAAGAVKWVDVDPDIAFAQFAIKESGLPYQKIADLSGCCVNTIKNIDQGATYRPLNNTLHAICVKALGYERTWLRNGVRVDYPKGPTKMRREVRKRAAKR